MEKIEIHPDRHILRIGGEDRQAFLQGLITQDVDSLQIGNAIFTSLLTPQGKILFDFFLVDTGDDYLIDCHGATAPALLKRLTLYKLRAKVTMENVETCHVLTSVDAPSADEAITYRDPRLDALGWRMITNIAPNNADHDGTITYRQRRIGLGVPELGEDFAAEEMFLLDVNYDALNGVSYKKGCFVGQEVTSRMKRKGEIRRRTIIASFDGSLPPRGTPITAGESTIGEILAGVDGQALAFVRQDRLEKARERGDDPKCGELKLNLSFPAYLKTV